MNVSELKEKIKEMLNEESRLKEEIVKLEGRAKGFETNRSLLINETKSKAEYFEISSLKLKIESLQNDVEYYIKEIKMKDRLIE
jgi:hypothetical protein